MKDPPVQLLIITVHITCRIFIVIKLISFDSIYSYAFLLYIEAYRDVM